MTARSQIFCFFVAAGLSLACGCGPQSIAGLGGGLNPDSGLNPNAIGNPINGDGTPTAMAFDPFTPAQGVRKVKQLLTGLPASATDIAAVTKDPAALAGQIDVWMATPGFQTAMLDFFGTALQQSQLAQADTRDQDRTTYGALPKTLRDLRQIIPRTAVGLMEEDGDFRQIVTGSRFKMNLPMMVYHAYLDTWQVSDDGNAVQRLIARDFSRTDAGGYPLVNGDPNFVVTLQKQTPTYFNVATDSTKPNAAGYLNFYTPTNWFQTQRPGVTTAEGNVICANVKSATFGIVNGRPSPAINMRLYNIVVGTQSDFSSSYMVYDGLATFGVNVVQNGKTFYCNHDPLPGNLTQADIETWKWVTLRRPANNERTTPFWDLNRLRKASEMALVVPRVGFMTSVAFLGQWGTNTSNQARVTMNQALIGASGRTFNGADLTPPSILGAMDPVHAPKGTSCYGCHLTMDPMRQFYRRNFTLSFHAQDSNQQKKIRGDFAQNGVEEPGDDMGDLAQSLVKNLDFAGAMTQKLCAWANSSPCSKDDPEVVRVAAAFAASGYKFKTLVRELMSSPLVTYASATATAKAVGQTTSIARLANLCNVLTVRLGLPNACALNLDPNLPVTAPDKVLRVVTGAYPTDSYVRGEAEPQRVIAPALFSRMGVEAICATVAVKAVVNGGPVSATDPTAAIATLVNTLMGASGTQATQYQTVLQGHYEAIKAGGASVLNSLRSTFVLACVSPSVASVGQ